jgi:hypothetical protein
MSPNNFVAGNIYHTITKYGYVDAYVHGKAPNFLLFTRFGWYCVHASSRMIIADHSNSGLRPHLSYDNWLEGPTPIHAVAREIVPTDYDQFDFFI